MTAPTRRLRTLTWPRQIPRAQRRALDTKHGGFTLRRAHVGDAFDQQRIRLAGNLLVFVEHGSVILERDGIELLLQVGDAAVVPPGGFQVTELPARPFTSGEVRYFFFNDRALAAVLDGLEGVDEIAARMSMPALPFYPVRNLGPALLGSRATGQPVLSGDFRRIFTVLCHTLSAPAYAFLKHTYFIRRFKLCLFLEDHCLGRTNAGLMAAMYPGGARAFRRECVIYLGMPVEQWLFRRRLELAYDWLRYSPRPLHEIAVRLGYQDLRRFRGDVRRFRGVCADELVRLRHPAEPRQQLAPMCLPFWLPSPEVRAARERQQASDWALVQMRRQAQRGRKGGKGSDLQTERSVAFTTGVHLFPVPVEASEENFLALHTTKVSNLIEFDAAGSWRMGGAAPMTGGLPAALAA